MNPDQILSSLKECAEVLSDLLENDHWNTETVRKAYKALMKAKKILNQESKPS